MSDGRISFRLWEPVQGYRELLRAWAWAKSMLLAGHRLFLDLRVETRSDAQNKLLHALFGDVSKQSEWLGKKRTPAEWKVLFVSGHSIATKEGAEMVPGLEGEFLNLRESTARMGKRRMASLLEYVMAWAVTNGVELREAREWIDPATGEVLNK